MNPDRVSRLLLALIVLLLNASPATPQGLIRTYPQASVRTGIDLQALPSGDYRMTAILDAYLKIRRSIRVQQFYTDPDFNLIEQSPAYSFGGNWLWALPEGAFMHYTVDWNQGPNFFRFTKTDPDNTVLWETNLTVSPEADLTEWMCLETNAQNDYFLAAVWISYSNALEDARLVVAKLTADGALSWQQTLSPVPSGAHIEEQHTTLRPTPDGGCLISFLELNNGPARYLSVKLDASGSQTWTIEHPYPVLDVLALADSGFLAVEGGEYGNSFTKKVQRLAPDGSTVWVAALDTVLAEPGWRPLTATAVIPCGNDGWALFGRQDRTIPLGEPRYFALRLGPDGWVRWVRHYDHFVGQVLDIRAGKAGFSDGSMVWVGKYASAYPILLRMDSLGMILDREVAGRVAHDTLPDCVAAPAEPGVGPWLLRLEQNGFTQYATSNSSDGTYRFGLLDTGALAMELLPPNPIWQGCSLTADTLLAADTLLLDMPVQSAFDCALLTVDLGVPALRRCFSNRYAVRCCNYGNAAADSARVAVFLPDHLLFLGASEPYQQDGSAYTFSLGTLAPFACRTVFVDVKPDCDSTELGQTLCVSARVFPDTFCAPVPGWSGALVEAEGRCEGDSVRFILRNAGTAPTSQPLNFIVIDDHVMTLEQPFQLAPGAAQTHTFAANGRTFRLLAEQEPNAPAPRPSVAVEGCGTPPFSIGLVVQWPNSTGSPFWDRDCREVVGSFDPNDKLAHPRGVTDARFVYPNTPIEYTIRFQNTGNDTAFTVVVRDTLTADRLDVATLRTGSASHPFTWTLSGPGILTVRFDDIMLPDSAANEPASHGFVQFWINQKPDLPDGALLENRAGIYFDYNAPIITNTVQHTVARDFVPSVAVQEPNEWGSRPAFAVWPNPAISFATVDLGAHFRAGCTLSMVDTNGKTVWQTHPAGAFAGISRGAWPAGVYWLVVRSAEGWRLGQSKILWK